VSTWRSADAQHGHTISNVHTLFLQAATGDVSFQLLLKVLKRTCAIVFCIFLVLHRAKGVASSRLGAKCSLTFSPTAQIMCSTCFHRSLFASFLTARDCVTSQGREAESEEHTERVCVSVCVFSHRGLFLPHVQELKGRRSTEACAEAGESNRLFLDCG